MELSVQVLIQIRRIIRAIDLHSRRSLQRYGLSGPQLVVLRALHDLGEMPGGRLAEAVSLSHATLVGILRRLDALGLVQKRRSVRDRRRVPISLTDKGRALVADAPPLLQESFVERFNELEDWERSQILASLQRIVALMEAKEVEAGPFLEAGAIGGDATLPGRSEPDRS